MTELARWAAQRAPQLVERAEREAVAALRDALVEAAVGRRGRKRRPPESKPRPTAAPRGQGRWAYCALPADVAVPGDLDGVDAEAPVERVVEGDLAALASRVPLEEFGEEPLRENLNDIRWLERVARAHEGVLERALGAATIVPFRLCTIYDDEQGVRRMLREERDGLLAALEYLEGRQEWSVKLLVDTGRLEHTAGRDEVEDDQDEESAGGAYMLRRRRERRMRARADELAQGLVDQVHARLQDWATDAVVNPPQNRELSGHEGEMLLNGAYLVEAERVEQLRELVKELEQQHRDVGARLELSGPWPPYNFVPGQGTATLS